MQDVNPNDRSTNDAKMIENMVERFKDHSARNNVFFCTAFQLDAEGVVATFASHVANASSACTA